MTKLSLIIFASLLLAVNSADAQFHFSGEKGIIFSAFPNFSDMNNTVVGGGVGFQTFLTRKIQLEFVGSYQEVIAQRGWEVPAHKIHLDYRRQEYLLHETVNYSLFRIFKHLYFNAGAGLSQRYRDLSSLDYSMSVDSVLIADLEEQGEEVLPVEATSYKAEDGFRFGGHVQLLSELYLSRRLTIWARYRYDYFIGSRHNPFDGRTSAGIRINF